MNAANQDLKQRFEHALALKKAEKYDEAIAAFQAIVATNPGFAAAWGMLGHIYWRTQDLERAVDAFSQATKLSPTSKLASLGLFHVLWELTREDEAIAEMRRFQSVSHSDDYQKIAQELGLKVP